MLWEQVPEASVSVNAALAGSNDIAISNVIGSNLFNGLVVVGVCAFMAGFKTNPEILKRDMPLNIIVTAILCIMLLDRHINHIEGIILLISMAVYIAVMVISALKTVKPLMNVKYFLCLRVLYLS